MAKRVIAVRLAPELLDGLDHLAASRGLSRSHLMREAVERAVDPSILITARKKYTAHAVAEQWARDQDGVARP